MKFKCQHSWKWKCDFHLSEKSCVALPCKLLTGIKHDEASGLNVPSSNAQQTQNGFTHGNFWNYIYADSIQMTQCKLYYFNLFINLSSQPFLFFPSVQHCKCDSCRECHKDALACLDFQQYYYEKYINLSVWKGFKGCSIHLLPEAEHLITQTQFSKKIISSSHVH